MNLKEYLQEEVEPCKRCPISDEDCRKVYERWYPEEGVPILICSEGPGFCEDRCGVPFVGAAEIMTTICGRCRHLKECFSWFLGMSKSYKEKEFPCQWPTATLEDMTPEMIADAEMMDNRYKLIEEFISLQNNTYKPRTAGQYLNGLLEKQKLYRASMVQYIQDKAAAVGKILTVYMTNVELPKPTVYMTNIVMCRAFSKEGKRKDNRTPLSLEIQNCAPHVEFVINALNPKVILALGRPAINTLTKVGESVQQSIRMATDGTLPADKFSAPVIPMYHPSFLVKLIGQNQNRYKEERQRFMESLSLAKKIANV